MGNDQETAGADEALADRLAIHELVGRYGYLYDERRIEEWLTDLFTPDAVLTRQVGDEPATMSRGSVEIRATLSPHYDANLAKGVQRRHMPSSVWIDEQAADRAHAHAYMLIMTTVPGKEPTRVAAAGHYEFDLVKRDRRWWIAAWKLGLDAPPT
ncbi:MAG: nuclear transport factor 2 family protein [Acidimicrobiia bacterium]